MTKKLLSRQEHYLQFDDEEMETLGLKPGQKFTIETTDDGGARLIPFKQIEIDLAPMSRETLEYWIKESCERDVSCNEIAIEAVKKALDDAV